MLLCGRAGERWSLLAAVACGSAACEPDVTSVGSWSSPETRLYLEAEDGELSGGFVVAADTTASSSAFIAPPADVFAEDAPGEARARYVFAIERGGSFTIWGRIRSPSALNNRFWIRVDDAPWYKWRLSVGDVWYWDDFHDDADYASALEFALEPGTHELFIANCASGAELDRLYVSDAGDPPPGNETSCDPPHSIELDGACHPSCGSQSGTFCGAVACAGKLILEAYDCDVCCRDAP